MWGLCGDKQRLGSLKLAKALAGGRNECSRNPKDSMSIVSKNITIDILSRTCTMMGQQTTKKEREASKKGNKDRPVLQNSLRVQNLSSISRE